MSKLVVVLGWLIVLMSCSAAVAAPREHARVNTPVAFNTGVATKVRAANKTRAATRAATNTRAPASSPTDPVLLGDTSVQSRASNAAGIAQAYEATATTTGTATDIEVYINDGNAATQVIVGLYSDSAGEPGALLTSGRISDPTSGAWNDITVSPVSITGGSTYWIDILGVGGTIQYSATRHHGEASYVQSGTDLTSLPQTFVGSQTLPTSPLSAYVNGTASTQPAPPIAAFTVSSSSPVTGEPVTFDGSASTCNAAPCSYQYIDEVNGATLGTSQVSQFTFQDVGTKEVQLTVTDTDGQSASVEHDVVVGSPNPAPQPPSPVSAPVISGSPQVGDTLTVSDGTWDGDTPMSFSVVWSDGTTGPSDLLTSADVGQEITATVTASNDAGNASATSNSVGPVQASSPPPPPPPGCTTTLSAGASIASAINNASSGSTICLNAGTYTGDVSVSGEQFTSYVTVEPAQAGADVTIDGGFTIDDSSFIELKGLDIEGGGIGGAGGVAFEGTSGSNYTLNNDTIANSDSGVIIGSSSGAVSNVTISNSTLHNFDFSGSSAGTGGGQAVSCYWCSGYTHVEHDVFYAASWHYIQCGGCSDFTVDHNLFSCPCNQHSGAHLNVFQIWQGGSDDSFTNNIVIGNPNQVGTSGEICGGCVLFENGPGGGTASDGFTNYDVSNNLFVNSGGSLPIQVQTTTGGTVSNNTVADGFQYGIAIGYNGVTNVASTSLVSQYNIVAGQTGNGLAYRYGCTGSGCVSDNNVADTHGGTSGTGSLNGWTEDWGTTSWPDPLTTPMPTGYYLPANLGSQYGYQGSIGP